MECREYQEQITAAIDNVLEVDERQRLDAHLAACPSCKNEFESEKLTRFVVKTRCQRMRAPGDVLERISQQLANEAPASRPASWWSTLVESSYFRPAIAFAVACIAVVLIVNNNPSVNGPRTIEASVLPANDIIKQSLSNYLAVVKGEIKPQVVSDQPDFVQTFFKGKTEFPVVVMRMSGCTLVGGVLNEFGGKTLAHVVYSHNKSEIIYVYETCWETLQSGSPLHLAQDVQDELKRTSWYSTTIPDGRSLVMWTNGKTLCSAVSKLDKETLLACLSAAE